MEKLSRKQYAKSLATVMIFIFFFEDVLQIFPIYITQYYLYNKIKVKKEIKFCYTIININLKINFIDPVIPSSKTFQGNNINTMEKRKLILTS